MRKVGSWRRLSRVAIVAGVAALLVGVPLAASADIAGFELDGNAASNGAADWDGLGGALFSTGVITDPSGAADRGYSAGGSKDTNDVSEWEWVDGTVTPEKDDIKHAYAAVYAEQGELVLYFGQDRALDRNGDANVGFWFLQNAVGLNADGSFSGTHADGDILVQSEFTNGGDVSGVHIFRWQGGSLQLVSNQAECSGNKLGTASACAIVNTGTISTSWAGDITSPYFFEGGLNLNALFPQGAPCFSTFLTNTRTSQSESAVLKDFALGDIDTCGSLTVRKVTSPSGGGPFSFTTTGAGLSGFDLSGGGEKTFDELKAGSYSVTESVLPSAWSLDSLSCTVSGPGTSASTSAATATITLGFLGNAVCTYTNKRQPLLTLVKSVVNDDGGTAAPGAWTLGATGTSGSFSGQANTAAVTSRTVSAGVQYTLAESGGPSAYSASDWVCTGGGSFAGPDKITLGLGDDVTCTITNDDQGPSLTLVKQVVNDDGGSASASDFTLTATGPTPISGAGGVTSGPSFDAGTYALSESAVAGYAAGSWSCTGTGTQNGASITLGLAQSATCTIVNDDQPATLIVRKVVVNDDGGSATADDFAFQVNGGAAQAFEADGQNELAVDAGTYNVVEPPAAGYETSYDNCSNVAIAPGGTATCTITNDDEGATLIVRKVVVNDDGGTATADDFAFQVNGGAAQAFEADGQNELTVDAGTYNVSEPGVAGYATSYDNCSQLVIPNGGSATCTITNDDEGATLIVRKVVVNDDGGSATADDFAFQVNGGAAQAFEADGQNELAVDAGTYNVVEPAAAGYATSYDNCSNVVVPSGGTATCTITNDDIPAKLVVKKVVVNDDGGTKVASDFSFQVNGGAAQAFEADGQNELAVDAGTYDVSEPGVAGYTTTYQGCANIVLPVGGSATCTVTNNDVPRGQGSISVSKSASPTTLKEPGGPVTFSVTITNTSADVTVTIDNVVDDKFGDLDDSGGNGCFDVPINLAPGEKVNCTFQRNITGQGGTSHVNVVTVTGHDPAGHQLTASDDARVDITERLIDLVIVKEASSPTPLNGTVSYSLSVTNKGPDTATNVQLADPAPAGITYLTANPSQGTCNLTPALVTCSLGSIAPGQTVTIAITGKATTVGQHTNTATVTGAGGRETNPADNVDSAVTVVPAPLTPPTPKPKPEPEFCLALAVSPKMVKADGKQDTVRVVVTAGKKRVKGVKVVVKGAGVQKTSRTNGKGVATLKINPKKAGLITISVAETNRRLCGPQRIGVVGVFLPPLTG